MSWHDSAFEMGWRYGDGVLKLPVVFSVGYITHLDKQIVEITGTRGETKGVLNPLAIPRGCIFKVERLK